jgi:glycine/D-amino acid oxidase-like deaminating enzyme
VRTTTDGRVLVGGEDEPGASRHESIPRLRRKTLRLLERFSAWFPDVRLEVAYAWAGVFGTTPDGLPFIGTLPEHPHTFFALGYGGNGITFSTIAADLACDWWRGVTGPDARLFRFDR